VVPAVNPVKLLVKLPDVDPSVVCKSVISGFEDVLQQIPLAVIVAPPLDEIIPPETAVVVVMEEVAAVVRVGVVVDVINEISVPYAVPALFIAYARTWYVVPADKPVRLLAKLPVPVPTVSLVLESLVVGLAEVDQQIPFAVMVPPPLSVISPPETAVVVVIKETAVVVRVGTTISLVIKETSFPYAVPALLVAYARMWYVVLGSNDVRLLEKLPVPVPTVSLVLESFVVGSAVVDQHIPLAVIVPPPISVIFPPETADVKVTEEASVVVRVGTTIGFVVNETSLP